MVNIVLGAVVPTVLSDIIGPAIKRALTKDSTPVDNSVAAEVTHAVVNELAQDPKVINAVSAEPPVQSRIVWGSSVGFVASVGIVITELGSNPFPSYNWAVLGPAVVTVFSTLYALYGRLKNGLKPLGQ